MRRAGKRTLVFDTSGAYCIAALGLGTDLLAERAVAMTRGQAEALMPLIAGLLADDGGKWSDIGGIGVGIGPGNFTGTRIAVAAARGLALGLGVRAVGVSAFEVMRDAAGGPNPGAELVLVAAPRGLAYAQRFRDGRPSGPPEMIDPAGPPETLRAPGMRITGHLAAEVARNLSTTAVDRPETGVIEPDLAEPDLTWIAAPLLRVSHAKLSCGAGVGTRPAPLYLRPADAAPPRDAPPVILAG